MLTTGAGCSLLSFLHQASERFWQQIRACQRGEVCGGLGRGGPLQSYLGKLVESVH